MKLISRFCTFDTLSKCADISEMVGYTKVSQYTITAMQWAVGSGIIKKDSDLAPRNPATRLQAAEFSSNEMHATLYRLSDGKHSASSTLTSFRSFEIKNDYGSRAAEPWEWAVACGLAETGCETRANLSPLRNRIFPRSRRCSRRSLFRFTSLKL